MRGEGWRGCWDARNSGGLGASGAPGEGRRTRNDHQRLGQDKDADAAMLELQANGIAAGVAVRPFNLLTDPHLVARGFWHQVERPFIGLH